MNQISLDTVCASLAYAMGIEPPKCAATPAAPLTEYIDNTLAGKKVDRVLMYNPDAIGQWVAEKYHHFLKEVTDNTELALPLRSVIPPVTPVCFGTMYTGAQPALHGIQEYVKHVIRIDTLFDALIRAGKRPIIVADPKCSMSHIYLERDMDYIAVSGVANVNAAAAKVILEDKHDFVVVYNGNFDYRMHRSGCETPETLAELRYNALTFAMLSQMVRENWKHHNTLVGFAMDHGCHDVEPFVAPKDGQMRYATHGSDIPQDMNIVHHYKIFKAID